MRQTTQYGLAHPSDESIKRLVTAGDVASLASALQLLKHDTRSRHAARMAAEYADRPRYAVSDDWSHYFTDGAPEFDTRWVFDRHRWCVTLLHVKRRSDISWSVGLPDEIEDLNESLVDANAGALDLEMGEFGVYEADVLPNWVSEATEVGRSAFVEASK